MMGKMVGLGRWRIAHHVLHPADRFVEGGGAIHRTDT